MNETTGVPPFPALIPTGPGEPAALALVLIGGLALAVALMLAGRRAWPLSARRTLLFLLFLALLAAVARSLPPSGLAAFRPGLTIAATILFWVALVEGAQALVLDFFLVRWLRRPPPPRILRDFLTLGFALAVFLVSLRGVLGVNLSSLLATSAVISVVLGLALQDTLGSFFAGLALQMESPLAAGEWVQVGETQGRVTQVGWRTVRIVTLDGDEVTFPNSLVTRSTLLNFSRPARAHRAFVPVRIAYYHPPHEVLAALDAAMHGVPGVLESPLAQALVWEFGESEVFYRARYWIDDYSRVNLVRSEVATRIWYQLRRAGIDHAYPSRVLRPPGHTPGREELALRAAAALGTVDLFQPLSDAERLDLAGRLRPVVFGRGEMVIRQGDQGDSLFLVTRGLVEVRVVTSGREALVGTLGAGSFFGEMSLLTGSPRSATVHALEDTEVFPVRREDFQHIASANPAVLDEVTRILSRRRDQLDETIRQTEAAAPPLGHLDLLQRVRSFFGIAGAA